MNTHRTSRSDTEGITSETMENKDPAINQHHTDSSTHYRSNTEDTFEKDPSDKDEYPDPNFQKNSDIAQDLDENLKNDNSDNKNLDEYKADKDGKDDVEE